LLTIYLNELFFHYELLHDITKKNKNKNKNKKFDNNIFIVSITKMFEDFLLKFFSNKEKN